MSTADWPHRPDSGDPPFCVECGIYGDPWPCPSQRYLDALRPAFVRFLTTDSETQDRRRRDFNQAIFNADGGWAVWSSTDLEMVLSKFDKAVAALRGRSEDIVAD